MALFGILSFLGFCAEVLPPTLPQTLLIECSEGVTISAEGQASITRMIRIPPSPLTELYRGYFEAYAKDETVRKDFMDNIRKQYQILLGAPGVDLRVTPPSAAAVLAAQPMEIMVALSLPTLARYEPKEKAWQILVGPQTREAQDFAVHELLNDLIFPSLYLTALPGEQTLVRRREVRFTLPKGARLLNPEELQKSNWSVDFGGGTYLKGQIRVEQNAVIFTQELTQTEKPPAHILDMRTAPKIFESLANFGVFKIKYALESTTSSAPLESQEAYVLSKNFSGNWGYSYSRTISTTLPLPSGGSLGVSATPSFYFGAHLGWEFRPWWQGGGLQKFEAWIDVNPSLTASLSASIAASLSYERSVDLWSYGLDFWFWVDYIPVWIRLSIEAGAAVNVNTGGRVNFSCSASAGVTNRLGARWEGSWSKIASGTPWAGSPSFSVTIGATTTLRAGPELALAAYVYNVAGPFVALDPYDKAEIKTSPRTWSLKVGFQASGGVKLAGWLQNLLGGLGSYSVNFYSWETTVATGSW